MGELARRDRAATDFAFWVGCRRFFHAGAEFPRRETFLFFFTRVPGTSTLGVWRAEDVDATRLAWPGSQAHGVVVELLVVADGGRRGRPMGTAVWGSHAGCEAGLEGGGANWSFGAFPLGEIPVLDDLRVANGEAGRSVAETGVAADVAAAVGGTADEGKKGAVSLLAEALKGAASAEAATPAPFILNEGMAIPGKVVARIVSKQFVDMAELLAENLTPVATLKEANPLSELVTGTRKRLRPVPDLTSWAACFAAYTIIRCSRHRDDATMKLGYMRLILQEASVFPAERWREYDVRFRTLAAAQPGLDWSRPHGTLFPRTFMRPEAAATGTSLPARCASCGDRYHTESQCPGRLSSEPDERSRTGRGRKGKGACYDWNYRESCRYGAACRFRHECLQCGGRGRVPGSRGGRGAKTGPLSDARSAGLRKRLAALRGSCSAQTGVAALAACWSLLLSFLFFVELVCCCVVLVSGTARRLRWGAYASSFRWQAAR